MFQISSLRIGSYRFMSPIRDFVKGLIRQNIPLPFFAPMNFNYSRNKHHKEDLLLQKRPDNLKANSSGQNLKKSV
ncbi:MAG: hypothetical protein JWR38_3373 [Mucilaginibacter sp.]|nr:hypothetical protein [Mucilaginibacter sp.]